MNFTNGNNHQILPEINIVSLIDIILLMVIFFMVTTTFVANPGLQVKLPKASSDVIKSHQRLEVTVTKEGGLYLNNEMLSLQELHAALQQRVRESEDQVVIIHADEMARHGMVVKVMDAARMAGLEDMAIATAPESGK